MQHFATASMGIRSHYVCTVSIVQRNAAPAEHRVYRSSRVLIETIGCLESRVRSDAAELVRDVETPRESS
jgi:hypothetical protein